MSILANPAQWILGLLLILSSLGVITARKPIYASLSFLLSLIFLAALYLQLSAEFIAVMQILVYAGAILVIFVFVIVLFQDAHQQIESHVSATPPFLTWSAIGAFFIALLFFGKNLTGPLLPKRELVEGFGSVQGLGEALFVDFFFPFEAIILLFLVAVVGSLYIAKRER